MKTMRIVFGFYQLLLSAASLAFVLFVLVMISRSDPNVHIHWLMVVGTIVLFGAGAGFCAANGIRWVAGSTPPFLRWKGLTPISILFTVLLTLVTAVMLARTSW